MQTKVVLTIFILAFVAKSLANEPCDASILTSAQECCQLPKMHDNSEIKVCVEKYAEQCGRIMASYSGEGPIRGCCMTECIFNVTHGAHKTVEEIKKDVVEFYNKEPETEWKDITLETIDKCHIMEEARKDELNAGYELPPLLPTDPVCHPKYQFQMFCSVNELVARCPSKYLNPTDECKKLQSFAQTCTF